ncbi:MAG TPA: diguanylate cyclase [Burkholderiales bacterium]|nr:diguanylate cyclase [Burkholderiales bacterium]
MANYFDRFDQAPAASESTVSQPWSDLPYDKQQAADFAYNKKWAKEGPYQTVLSPEQEQSFRSWVKANNVNFNPDAQHPDYDMRGFWLAAQQGDKTANTAVNPYDHRIHFPDTWKTPFDRTFSRQSKYATADAPDWGGPDGQQLITRDGRVIFDQKHMHEDAPPPDYGRSQPLPPALAAITKPRNFFDQFDAAPAPAPNGSALDGFLGAEGAILDQTPEIERAAGGLAGAANFATALPKMIIGGAGAAVDAPLHALFPQFFATPSDVLNTTENAFRIEPGGEAGRGQRAAEKALGYPFELAAKAGGNLLEGATSPVHATRDRFGRPIPTALQTPVETQGQEASREAVTGPAGEALTNLAMLLAGGKGARPEAVRPGVPVPAVPLEGEYIPRGADLGSLGEPAATPALPSRPVRPELPAPQPYTVDNLGQPENITLAATPEQQAADAFMQQLREYANRPTTEGIDVQPTQMQNVTLADNFTPPAKPSTKGLRVTEIPQTEVKSSALDAGAATGGEGQIPPGSPPEAVTPIYKESTTDTTPQPLPTDAEDATVRARLTKPSKDMTPEEKDLALDTDVLTLLPNRRAFEGAEAQKPANAYSAIDLIGFKNLNDTIGHAAGDEVLKAWGKILRHSGLDAFRTGGDEFTVRGETTDGMEHAMQSLKGQLQDKQLTFEGLDGKSITVPLDFRYGIGETPKAADEAQIRNRNTGRGAPAEGASDVSGVGERAQGSEVPGDHGQTQADQRGSAETEARQEVIPPAAEGGKFSRRIFRNDRRTPTNFVVPETPEFEGNMSGDLSRFPDTAKKRGIKPLPIRLPVGVARGDHRGFGVEHMAENGDAYPAREPPQYTDNRAENYARHVAAIARSGTEGYVEGNRIIMRSPRMREALVLQERDDSTGHYYSVVTTVPAEESRWGYPAWTGRSQAPVAASSQHAAPELTPGQKTEQPDRLSPEPQTERYDLPPKGEPSQEGKRSVGETGNHSVESLREGLKTGLGPLADRLERAKLLKLHETAQDIPGVRPSEAEGVQGYFDGKTAHLAADGIAPGNEVGVLLHEATHASADGTGDLKTILGVKYTPLIKQLHTLMDAGDERVAKARLRVPEDTPAEHHDEEWLSYLIEDVANTEANKRAATFGEKVMQLYHRVVHTLRAWVASSPLVARARRFGIDLNLKPEDLVALARRAAHKWADTAEREMKAPEGESQPAFSQDVGKLPSQEDAIYNHAKELGMDESLASDVSLASGARRVEKALDTPGAKLRYMKTDETVTVLEPAREFNHGLKGGLPDKEWRVLVRRENGDEQWLRTDEMWTPKANSGKFSRAADANLETEHGKDETTDTPLPDLAKPREPVPTGNIEDALHVLRNQKALDSLDALTWVKAAVKDGMTAADNRTFMDYIEQAHLPEDQRTVTLTPRQRELFDKFIVPIREALGHEAGYVPREAKGKGGKLDQLLKETGARFGVGTLRKNLGSSKHRVFHSVTDEAGNREIAAVKRESGAAMLHIFRDGEVDQHVRVKYSSSEKELEKKLAPIEQRIATLHKEKRILTATKSRRLAAAKRIRNIDNEINDALAEQEAIVDQEHGINGRFFVSKGKRYRIGEATANEVEAATGGNVEYHRNVLGKLLDEYVANRQVQRQTEFLDALKASPAFAEIATQDHVKAPDNWRPVTLPQFHGYVMEPYTAEVLNHYAATMRGERRVPYLSAANDLLRKAMFSILPVWHDFNLTDIALTQRGVTGFATPQGIARLVKTMGPAIKEVMTLGPKYQRLSERGAPLMRANSMLGMVTPEAFADIVNSLGRELDEKPELHPIAKALGYVPGKVWDAAKWWGKHAQQSIWTYNDVVAMQAIMEREAQGMSEDEAVKEVFSILPNYRLPQGKRLLNIVTHPDISWFARYHLGLFRAYGHMIKDLVRKNATLKQRARALDQLAMVGLLSMVVYPLLDALVQQASDNKKAHVARFGLSAIPYDLYKWTKGQESLIHFLVKQFTPAPGTYEFLQQAFNRDFWSGDQVAPFYDTTWEAMVDRVKHLKGTIIPLSNYLEGQTPVEGALRQIGFEIPAERADKIRKKHEKELIKRRREAEYFRERDND